MTYLYLKHVNSAVTNKTLCLKDTDWDKPLMYELESPKLPRRFESLPDSLASALGIMKLKPPSKDIVELHKQVKV